VGKIAALCEDINRNFDAEAIHKFRTSVKKLRAFLRLLEMNKTEPDPKLTNKFKHLYHIAGNIRDAELAIEKITRKQLPLPTYLETLQTNVAHNKKEWQLHYSKNILSKLENKLTSCEFHALHPEALEHLVSKSVDNIRGICKTALPGNNEIHSLRKIMKDLLYLSAFTDKHWKDAAGQFEKIPSKSLEELTDIIGNFNDQRLSMEQMIAFTSQNIHVKEKNAIETFCNEEAMLLTEKKKHIVTMVKEFIGSLNN